MSAQSASEIDATNPFPDLPAIRGHDTTSPPARPSGPTPPRFPSPRFGDYSRTRFESRVAFGGPDEDPEEIAAPTRQFSFLEITSGLPEDSREVDERAAERRLSDLRGRVKAARAVVASTSGAEVVLRQDWVKAAHFYARFSITETHFRHGVPDPEGRLEGESLRDSPRYFVRPRGESLFRAEETLPESVA